MATILYFNQSAVLTHCHTTLTRSIQFVNTDGSVIGSTTSKNQNSTLALRLILLINQCTIGIITDLLLCSPKHFLYGLANFHFNLQSTMHPSYAYRLPLESFSSSCIFSTRDVCSFCFFRVNARASKIKIDIPFLELNKHKQLCQLCRNRTWHYSFVSEI